MKCTELTKMELNKYPRPSMMSDGVILDARHNLTMRVAALRAEDANAAEAFTQKWINDVIFAVATAKGVMTHSQKVMENSMDMIEINAMAQRDALADHHATTMMKYAWDFDAEGAMEEANWIAENC